VRVLFELIEWYKLDDIGSSIHSVSVRVQGLIIAIKCIHVAEISIANTYDDDT